jgi:hypothetical protein
VRVDAALCLPAASVASAMRRNACARRQMRLRAKAGCGQVPVGWLLYKRAQ